MDYRALSQMELATESFPVVQHEFRIFIEEKAFDCICNSADATREVGGILVGEVLRDENGPFIRVDAIIEALHAEESGTELTITHATWNHIHQQMDSVHQGKRIIGWYHTHPNFGIFLSERDRFIQQSFFDLPFQIALVYDPVRREHGIFSWRENKPWRVRQYWIGANEHLWDSNRDTPEEPTPKDQISSVAGGKQAQPARRLAAPNETEPGALADMLGNSWVPAALLLGLLLGFGLGMFWERRNVASEGTNRAQTAQEIVASLDSDLLAVLRGSLSDEAFSKIFDDGIARLDRAAEALKPLNISDPAVKTAVDSVTEAQQYLSRARQDRLMAHEMLQQIEQVMRRRRTPEFVARDMEYQRALLAGIYVELAHEAAYNKDGARVSEMLRRAAAIDPARQAAYEQLLKDFEEHGTLPHLGTQGGDNKQQGPAPATSVTPASSPAAEAGG